VQSKSIIFFSNSKIWIIYTNEAKSKTKKYNGSKNRNVLNEKCKTEKNEK